MPELNLRNIRRDLRLPELRLPEMSRDDIAKALGEARKELRDVRKDLQDFRREFEMPRVEVTEVEVPKVDVEKVTNGAKQMAVNAKQSVMDAAEAAGLVKAPAGRSRKPFVLAGMVTLGVLGFALLNSPAMKTRLRDGAQRARERMNSRRTAWGVDDETHAFDAAAPAGVDAAAYSDAITSTDSPFAEPPTELPEGLGSESEVQRIEEDAPARA
jgi:hypothetical protein